MFGMRKENNMGYNYQSTTPLYPSYGYVPQPIQPQPTNQMIWVKGESEARNYPVQPNSTIPLWDNETQTIYLKSVDASGMPTIKTLKYTIDEPKEAEIPTPNYADCVTKADFDDFAEKVWEKFDQIGKSFTNKSNNTFVKNKEH